MTRYKPPLEGQFPAEIRALRSRIATLEQRTNPVGTNSDGSVTVSNLTVVGDTGGTLRIVPTPGTLLSPALTFDGGVAGLTSTLASVHSNVSGTAPNQFEALFGVGPVSSGDSAGSCVRWALAGGGTGADAAHGQLVFSDAAMQQAVGQWDQWGMTLSQPASGSFAGLGPNVIGSAIQNDQPPYSGSLPKFFHPSGYAGTTNASGELTFNHGCAFTPQGMVVNVNAAGVGFNLSVGVESNRFTSTQATFWVVNAATAAAYASSFLTFYALLWG